MAPFLVAVVSVWLLETLMRSERPEWLARLARSRLDASASFALDTPAAPVDTTYREPGAARGPRLPTITAFRAGTRRVRPAGPNALAIVDDGWRARQIVRIVGERAGSDVVLRAYFVPTPLSLHFGVPIAAIVYGISSPDSGHPAYAIGLAVGFVVATFASGGRARDDAMEATRTLFPAIEEALRRAGRGDGIDPSVAPDSVHVRSRLFVAMAGFVLLTSVGRLASERDAHEQALRSLTESFGVDRAAAETLLPHITRVAPRLSRVRARAAGIDGSPTEVLVTRGVPRLSEDELLRWEAIREELSGSSAAVCAAFGSGTPDATAVLTALAGREDATVDDWLSINAHAAELGLELRDEIDVVTTRAAVERGVEAMAAALPEPQRAAFLARLRPVDPVPAAACDALRALFEGLSRLDRSTRVELLRATLTQAAIGL